MSEFANYTHKHNYYLNLITDQTIITKKSLLPRLPGIKLVEDPRSTSLPPSSEDWYPYVNSYYPFTEDVDAVARVSHLLESKHSGDSLDKETDHKHANEYSERKAHRQFLRTKPTSFLILGKPGFGQEEIGQRLADYWKCVYIDPLILLEEEIAADTRAGQCIEFNLRCGRAVGVDILIRLLTKKVQTPLVLHRGFVVCGFPLIPNDLYEEDPISSESAVFNVKEIFEEIIDQTIKWTDVSNKVAVSLITSKDESETEKESTEERETLDESMLKMSLEWSIENQICGPPEIATDFEKQLSCLFGIFQDPFLLIYVYGKNSDVVSRRDNYFYDVYSKQTVDIQKIKLFYELGATNEFLIEDLFDNGRNPFAENPELKHLVKLPEDMSVNVSTQLDRYHSTIANQLDSRILLHDIQYYIKLDGRAFISQLLNLIKLRLKILPLPRVIIPQKFRSSNFELPGEGAVNEEAFMSLEEAFLKFSKENIVAPIFKWHWSDWGTLCPVSMFFGIYRNGSPKFAVRFLNKIYFLNNENFLEKFLTNPRPYLLPPFPKPGSRVFVFGPPISGKSAVSKCLGYLLNSQVLTPDAMHTDYYNQVVQEHKEKVKQVAIAEALEILSEKKKEEMATRIEERNQQIQKWEKEARQLLTNLRQVLARNTSESSVLSSFPLQMAQTERHRRSVDEDEKLRENLKDLNFPFIDDLDQCNKYLEDREALLSCLPQHLKDEIVEEIPSVFDSFVLNYVDEKVQAIEVDEIKQEIHDNMYEMYVRGIKTSEDQSGRDGWIIDGMTTDMRLLKQVLEDFSTDDIIVLYSSDYNYLLERFKKFKKNVMHFREFRDFFLRIGEKDAAWRSPSVISTESYKKELAEDILSDVLKLDFDEEIIASEKETLAEKYYEELKTYEREIENVKKHFEEIGLHADFIDVNGLNVEDILRDAIYAVESRYRRSASRFTQEDRAEEVQNLLAQTVMRVEGEGAVNEEIDDYLAKNRRYGDTLYYCPVTFAEKFVLWRGKEEFAAKFKDRVYLFANEENLKKFLKYPRQYLIQNESYSTFPPPRICIVGSAIKLRTQVAQQLANNLGVRYYNFQQIKSSALEALSSMSLLVQNEETEVPEALTLGWYDTIFSTVWRGETKYVGFVFEDFPRSAQDLNYMISRSAIPDVIICLNESWDNHLKRELEESLNELKATKEKHRQEEEIINLLVMQEWEEKRKARYSELMEAKKHSRYTKKISKEKDLPNADSDSVEIDLTSDTQISFDSVVEQQEHDETMKILDEELPEPVLQHSTEIEQQLVEDFTKDIEKRYTDYVNFLEDIKTICNEELISCQEINLDLDFEKVLRSVFIIGDELKFRGPSFFEQCFDVSLEIADKLLEQGYFLLSTFGKVCPVQFYTDDNPLHTYIASEQKHQIFPVIHRQYIYFLVGKENRDRFFKNPLKYITSNKQDFRIIPGRVAIIGPPKSGKTSLANRFRRDLGFRVVSLGESVRYTLNHPLYTKLHQELEEYLKKGDELPEDILAECVNVASFCGESVTQGLIFDGFPNTITGTSFLFRLGLIPHLIFDLQIGEERIYELAANPTNKYPQYSQRFIKHLYNQWKQTQELFRIWTDREYQNIFKLDVDRSIWGVWEKARTVTFSVMYERKHYYKHIKEDWPLRLANMLVTPYEFLERQSSYKVFCPGCLYYFQKFKNGGDPPDRTGLVQYLSKFYWLCEEHIEEFLKDPEKFFPPSNICLPQEIPTVVQISGPCDAVEDGYCIVCYQENFPQKVLVKGSPDYAVRYHDKIFLFEGKKCLQEFMATPEAFCNMTINFKEDNFASLKYKDLPVLGMLEQFLARTVVRACNTVNFYRPVVPGLSISQAAIVCLGLNLKVHNPGTKYLERYKEGLEIFHQRRADLLKYLEVMKMYRNPMIWYEEPETPSSTDDEDTEEGKLQSMSRIFASGV